MGQSRLVAECREIRTVIKSIGCMVFLCISLSACTTYNTATGRNEMILISTSSEVSMGNQIHRELCTKNKIILDAPAAKRIERIGKRLARISDRQDYEYHFYLVDSKEINAFTVPGGHIYCYTGLYEKLTTDDQVAAVLAHEIGHCAAKHTIKKFQGAMGLSVARNVLLKVLSVKAPGIENIAAIGADGLMQLAMSGYSRADELQADQIGIKYLHLSGYNLNAMIEAFRILETTDKSQVPLMLRTHPFAKDRITAAQKVIETIKRND